jgi:aspartate aminotransferase
MPTLSNRAMGMQESAIRKLDLVAAAQRDVRFHRLNIGQPDVPTPAPMLDAIAQYDTRVIAYGPASGTAACRAAAAEYTSRWSPGIRAEHVAITQGGSEGLLFAFCAMCDPGDEILVPEPYYTNYNGFATVAGATVKPIRTRIETGFALPPDHELDRLVTPRTKVLILNTPSNPTGAVYGADELARMVAWAKKHHLFVVSDEVYRQIWFEEPAPSALAVAGGEEHVLVVDSMSKTWSSCGLRLGWLVSRNMALMEKIERLGQARLGAQPLAQAVAMRAFDLPESYYAEVRQVYADRVGALADAVERLGVRAPRPKGAFYMMIDLPVSDADAFARWLVTDFRDDGESVVIAPGTGFYANPEDGRRQARLAAVSEPAVLSRAVEVLGRGLDAFGAR